MYDEVLSPVDIGSWIVALFFWKTRIFDIRDSPTEGRDARSMTRDLFERVSSHRQAGATECSGSDPSHSRGTLFDLCFAGLALSDGPMLHRQAQPRSVSELSGGIPAENGRHVENILFDKRCPLCWGSVQRLVAEQVLKAGGQEDRAGSKSAEVPPPNQKRAIPAKCDTNSTKVLRNLPHGRRQGEAESTKHAALHQPARPQGITTRPAVRRQSKWAPLHYQHRISLGAPPADCANMHKVQQFTERTPRCTVRAFVMQAPLPPKVCRTHTSPANSPMNPRHL